MCTDCVLGIVFCNLNIFISLIDLMLEVIPLGRPGPLGNEPSNVLDSAVVLLGFGTTISLAKAAGFEPSLETDLGPGLGPGFKAGFGPGFTFSVGSVHFKPDLGPGFALGITSDLGPGLDQVLELNFGLGFVLGFRFDLDQALVLVWTWLQHLVLDQALDLVSFSP